MIKVHDLTFFYGDAARPALQDIDLEIGDGEFVLVTGPSGCGKSTLCRCFNGLVPHFYGGRIAGEVRVQGLDVMRHATRELATKVGMVFQDPENQLVSLVVDREVAFGLENLAVPRDLMGSRSVNGRAPPAADRRADLCYSESRRGRANLIST